MTRTLSRPLVFAVLFGIIPSVITFLDELNPYYASGSYAFLIFVYGYWIVGKGALPISIYTTVTLLSLISLHVAAILFSTVAQFFV